VGEKILEYAYITPRSARQGECKRAAGKKVKIKGNNFSNVNKPVLLSEKIIALK
jgi:hypothetical protein